ncbi:MAG: hypothetical protein LBM77_11705 [Spirochaetaceae bacterium]|jgi:hypothetical protein|nr:hypothetical protein [Spirochaetaceae bacterium]
MNRIKTSTKLLGLFCLCTLAFCLISALSLHNTQKRYRENFSIVANTRPPSQALIETAFDEELNTHAFTRKALSEAGIGSIRMKGSDTAEFNFDASPECINNLLFTLSAKLKHKFSFLQIKQGIGPGKLHITMRIQK